MDNRSDLQKQLDANKQKADEAYKKRMSLINQLANNLFNLIIDGETVNVKIPLNKGITLLNKPKIGLVTIHKSVVFSEIEPTI